jgi:hypothetical protein
MRNESPDFILRRARLTLARIEIEALGLHRDLILRRYDPDQPRVPAGDPDGGQWTSGEGGDTDETRSLGRLLSRLPRVLSDENFGLALGLFGRLSAENGPGRQAVLEFNARAFERGYSGAVALPRVLERAEVDAFCPRLGEVETRAERAVAAVRAERRDLPPASFGTAAHMRLRESINRLGNPNFRAEVSILKSQEVDRSSGRLGNIRVDVFEKVSESTVCVYDLKTGTRGLSAARFREIGEAVRSEFPAAIRTIITEVRVPR